jgi:hypothetical protein
MVKVSELMEWLATLDPTWNIGVDEGGLTLEVTEADSYYEIGGLYDDEDEDED